MTRRRVTLSLTLLLGGATALLAGVYILSGLGPALVAAGVLAFAAEWLLP